MRPIAFIAALLLAGCTTGPDTAPRVEQPQFPTRPASPVVPQERGDLIGLTAAELVQRLGNPALQIREGQSLKLQFRAAGCILDAYLYRPASGQGIERVAHVDARLRSGAEMNQRACISELGPR